MTTQRTPDELGIENEAICETLLGWKRSSIVGYWFPSQEHAGTVRTPSFTNWADAGLILDALFQWHSGQLEELKLEIDGDLDWKFVLQWDRYEKSVVRHNEHSGPLAIRAAALEYIRSQP